MISGRNQEKRTSIRDGHGGRFKQPDVTSGQNRPVVFSGWHGFQMINKHLGVELIFSFFS